jgi:hypothetical protein
MAHTWKYALGLGLMGAALSVGCTVSSGDDDSSFAGQSGEGGSSGTGGSGGKGGSGGTTSTGGTGGTTGGSAGSGGATTGGSAGAGTGGSASGSGGTGGSTSGSGGSGVDTSPTCDGDTMGTPYPDCDPGEANKDDPCALCIQHSCCEESKNCYATEPYNVCGWGGPSMDDPMLADYAGAGEIGCITTCLAEYVTENEVCDTDGIDGCTSMCQTPMCSLVGSATSDLFTCMQDKCASSCFGADTCN